MSKDVVKRIANIDMKQIKLMNLNESGIFIEFDESDITKATAMIIGPKNTPYENGGLFFYIEFPFNYPFSPPKVEYMSNSFIRCHPNLYRGKQRNNYRGKVCLSVLNTWSGPKWTSVMHIGSILLTIQSILTNDPLHHEPGYEQETGQRNEIYNDIVNYNTIQFLIYGNLIQQENYVFTEIIQKHLLENKDEILGKISSLMKKYEKPTRITMDTYRMDVTIDYVRYKNAIEKYYESIKY